MPKFFFKKENYLKRTKLHYMVLPGSSSKKGRDGVRTQDIAVQAAERIVGKSCEKAGVLDH